MRTEEVDQGNLGEGVEGPTGERDFVAPRAGMRTGRIRNMDPEAGGFYHCMSRVTGGEFIFGAAIRGHFVKSKKSSGASGSSFTA